MIKTTMNVRIKFAKDNTSNNASVELLVPKVPNNSEMGCTKVSALPQSTDDRRFVLTREHFELIANERNEKINLYSKDPILLKCEVEPVERVCETGYVMHFFKVKFSESVTRCFKYAPYQEGNLKFVKLPFEFNKQAVLDEETIEMLNIKENKKAEAQK